MSAAGMKILLMSSTIAPNVKGSFLLKVTDPMVRLGHYLKSFEFHCHIVRDGAFDRLVFVDNSGYSLDPLREVARRAAVADRTEFISYTSLLSSEKSRYYLEMKLICHAMQHSATISASPAAKIWKMTGRYVVANIARIVTSSPSDVDLHLNLRNYPDKTLDTYLIGYRAATFSRHLGKDIEDFDNARNGEDVLREKIDAGAFGDVKICPRFKYTPRLYGVRGYDGAEYGGAKGKLKYLFRASLNRMAPAIWV